MEKIVLCNACRDDKRARVSSYLLEQKQEEVIEGVKIKVAELQKAEQGAIEIMYVLSKGSNLQLPAGVSINYAEESMILANEHALVQALCGKAPRPVRFGEPAVFSEKEVIAVTPLEAYQTWQGEQGVPVTRFCFVHTKEQVQVMEVALGAPLSTVIEEAGVTLDGVKGILLGGLTGTFVSVEALSNYKVSNESLYDSMVLYDQSNCMVTETAKLYTEIQAMSCGKCVLCREGSLQFMTIVEEMAAGKAKSTDVALLKDVAPLVKIGAYCGFGQKMPTALLSAIELFASEFDAHISKKACPAGVCSAFSSYCIVPDDCTGCEDCIDECPEEAIVGKKGFIHMIDEDMCTKCGKCLTFCDEGAIIMVTGKKPKLPKKLTKVGKF